LGQADIKTFIKGWRFGSVVELLPSVYKDQSSVPSTAKTRNKPNKPTLISLYLRKYKRKKI
jgi:hypothetical protein